MTSMFAKNVASLDMTHSIKSRNTEVVTVMGGASCESPMRGGLVRHASAVDFLFSGPALASFPEFVHRHRTQGVFSHENVDAPFLKGHDAMEAELPIEVPVLLDYESFLADLGRNLPGGMIQPSLTFETSRGCWWGERSHCTFCGMSGAIEYRSMPSEQALAVFQEVFEKYGNRYARYESMGNIKPRPYIKEVFSRLTPPPGVRIFYEVKADLKDWEMEVLSQTGVTPIQPGIEALSTSTLKLMRNGTIAFQNVAFLKNCVHYGIDPSWDLLIGFPREAETVYEGYLRVPPLLMHLPPPPPPSGAFKAGVRPHQPKLGECGEQPPRHLVGQNGGFHNGPASARQTWRPSWRGSRSWICSSRRRAVSSASSSAWSPHGTNSPPTTRCWRPPSPAGYWPKPPAGRSDRP
jgi:ribosomal peptide maturation radical SAM protein 1